MIEFFYFSTSVHLCQNIPGIPTFLTRVMRISHTNALEDFYNAVDQDLEKAISGSHSQPNQAGH